MELKILKLKGYKNNELIVDKKILNTTISEENLLFLKEKYYNLYRKRGVLVDYVDLVYREIKDNKKDNYNKGKFKINPSEVYNYHVENPDKDLKDLAYKFNLHERTIKRYIKLFLD